MEPENKEPQAGGPEALQNRLNNLKLSGEREQLKAKVAEENRVALQCTGGLIESLAIYCEFGTRTYWLRRQEHSHWSPVKHRDVKMLFQLKGLNPQDLRRVMFIIQVYRGIDVLGPPKAHKARLGEHEGRKCLIADFPEPVLSDDELAELRLDRDEWDLDTDGRGATIATAILNNNWEDAIPQIAHAVTIIDAVKRPGGFRWSRSFYDYNFRNRKWWLKGWVKGLRRDREGGITK